MTRRFGVRGTLFLSLSLLGVVVGTTIFSLVGNEFRAHLTDEFESNLARQAKVGATVVSLAQLSGLTHDDLADRIAEATGRRVTLIAADGRVQGDSALAAAEVRGMDNHAARNEVASASIGIPKIVRRYSTTLEREMIYAAHPIDRPPDNSAASLSSVIRLAVDPPVLSVQVEREFNKAMAVAAFALLALCGLLAHVLANEFTRRPPRGQSDKRSLSDAGGSESFSRINRELQDTLAELSDERTRFETVLESMGEALIALDSDLKITLVNPAAVELLDLVGDVVGRDLVAVNRAPGLNELAERGRSESVAAEFDLPGPARRRVLARATPLKANGGTVVNLHDVTEMRRLERIRRDFVANVSHELRTPVAIIRANAETLMSGGFDDEKRGPGFVNAIHRNSERLAQLIADLLDLSRVEAGSYRLLNEPQNVADAAARSVAEIETFADERELTVENRLPTDQWVSADAKALDQILLNLVHNAAKYTGVGGHVTIEAEPSADDVVISVKDDGPGIAAHHRSRIFERFYRVDAGRAREVGGTGLGLAIVKHLVESMSGSVSVEANDPTGTVFRVVLPASEAPSAQDATPATGGLV